MAITFNQREAWAMQNLRLVNKDFPWLWAVRGQWCQLNRRISVCNSADTLETFLKGLNYKSRVEIWVRCSIGGDPDNSGHTVVEKVHRPKKGGRWADKILSVRANWRVENVVTIVYNSDDGGWEKVTVYRSKDPKRINYVINCLFHGRKVMDNFVN